MKRSHFYIGLVGGLIGWAVCFAEPSMDPIEGILLIGKSSHYQGIQRDDLGEEPIRWVDLCVPGRSQVLKEALQTYLGRPISKETLLEIKRKIITFYRDQSHPLVIVSIPEQEISNGIVQLLVQESTLDQIIVYGNKWFSKESYKGVIRMEPGEVIDEHELLNDLNSLNRNRFRQVDLLYAAGELPHTTNIELIVRDRFPLSVYAGVDNTGLTHTERIRWFAGATWGNVFGCNQTLSVQYTAAPDIRPFSAITGNYTIPLPNQNTILFYGGYSEVYAHVPLHSKTHGRSLQASVRYTIPMNPSPWLLHEFTWGYDFKRSNNTVNFVENFPVIGQDVNLTQFMVGYNLGYERDYSTWRHKMGFDIELFFSPFTWLPHQSKMDFHTMNPFADPIYVYGRASFNYKANLQKGFEWTFLCTGQLSNQSLLPSEELGIGGYNTVRGYEERQLNADDGVLVSTELYFPKINFITNPIQDRLAFLLFADYGWAHYNHRLPKQPQSSYLLGAGPGIRYQIEDYFFARLDWGIKCRPSHYPGGWSMIHFSVSGSF